MMDLIKKQIESPESVAKFTRLVGAITRQPADRAAEIYELEKFHFLKETGEKNLGDVSPMSAMGTFLDVVSNGLSFASGAKHVYLLSRNINVGTREAPKWEKRLYWSATPDGVIYMCQRSGAIDHVTKPVMVYQGEPIKIKNIDGLLHIEHEPSVIREPGAKLIGGYVYTVYKNGSREALWMDMNDVSRLAAYSNKNNKDKGANALYSSGPGGTIDVGFFGAKLLKHALKNVRKNSIASVHEVEADEADTVDVTHTEVKHPHDQPLVTMGQYEMATNAHEPKPNQFTDLFD